MTLWPRATRLQPDITHGAEAGIEGPTKLNLVFVIDLGPAHMTLDSFLKLLDRPHKNGKGYTARCPAHEDKSPSFSVKEGRRRLLVTCFAGCSTEEICSSLGLTERDLYYRTDGEHSAAKPQPPTLSPDLQLATLFVDLHRPKPEGRERLEMIDYVYRQLL